VCQGGYWDIDRVKKMDCRANGEVAVRAIRALDPDFVEYATRWEAQDWFLEKEMGYAIKLFNPRTTHRRYPMLPAVITNVHQAFKEIKHMTIDTWQEECRLAARRAMKEVLETRMHNAVDAHLDQMRATGLPDRRNGSFSSHLLTEIGDLELRIPRTRTFSAHALLRKFARRTASIERTILMAFLLGLSTRKVGPALLSILGEPISPSTVSQIAKQLDQSVQAYHQRALSDQYEILVLDGIVMRRKTGVGAQRRTMLVALGIKADGKKEIIDFRQVLGESQSAWEGFLSDLYQRGLEGHTLKLMIVDGGKGLLAALPLVYGHVPLQRCWTHKTRNVLNYVKRADQESVKRSLHRISHARNLREAQKAAQRFVARWNRVYPKAVDCLQKDLPELLTFLQINTKLPPSVLRTTNAIERRFVEVRRRTRPMGTFSDRTSMERILFSVFTHENIKQRTATPFLLLTQKS
jgi:putative transposase